MSTYSDWFVGRRMSDGRIYRHSLQIVATRAYPLGTRLTLTLGGKSVDVTVSDRTAKRFGHRIDASRSVWSALTKGAAPGLRQIRVRRKK